MAQGSHVLGSSKEKAYSTTSLETKTAVDDLPYVAKCSRSIIFANFANGAHSRISRMEHIREYYYSRTFMFQIHGIYIFVYALL